MEEKGFKEGEAMAAVSSSSLFTHPSSLLHQVVHGCVGYLASLCRSLQNLKPGAPAAVLKQDQADDNEVTNSTTVASSEEHVAVQISTRTVATPQRPLLREGNGGKGGAHHSTGF